MTTGIAQALAANLLSPAVLFFALGIVAALAKSDLRFPEALYVTLTIYLLVAIGFKGGVAIHDAGAAAVLLPGLAAIALGTLIPLWTYPLLRFLGRFRRADAASIAAHYGSVSAVTFIAATDYLKGIGVAYEPYAAAFLAVMESPAIIVGVLLGRRAGDGGARPARPMRAVLHEAVFGRSVLLLVGSLAIGALCGQAGMQKVEAFFVAPFQGVLALFLLELGMVAGQRLGDLRRTGAFLIVFGIAAPVLHACLGILVGIQSGLGLGGTTLMGVLAASASYIAAPAAMRLALPDANPTLSLTASLAITFPFNIAIGIPLYYDIARHFHG